MIIFFSKSSVKTGPNVSTLRYPKRIFSSSNNESRQKKKVWFFSLGSFNSEIFFALFEFNFCTNMLDSLIINSQSFNGYGVPNKNITEDFRFCQFTL